ncbi:MAG: extracellular solute-binding protein [Actinomycetota bacterium]|nr:extracellular solute-binding protein [Actinomycetota bacterium]
MTSRRHRPQRLVVSAIGLGSMISVAAYGGGAANASNRTNPHSQFAGQTLTVFDGAPSGADAHQTQEYYNDVAALFHKETGANLQWSYYSSAAQEVTTVETSTVSGSGPDIISYGTSFVGTLQKTGDFPLLSTKNWNTLGGRKSFIPADLFDSGASATKDIGVPYETNPFTMVYNTAYFKKAGIKSPPTTWTQVVQDSKLIQKKIPGVYGAGIDPQDPYDPWKSVYFIDDQLGGGQKFKPFTWISPNGKQVKIDGPHMQKAVNFYFSLIYKYHIVPKQALTWNGAEMASAFEQGKIAMVLIGGYGYQAASIGTKVQGHVGYALLPTVPYGMSKLPPGGRAIETETTGNYWAIPGYASKERALALEFEKLTLSPAIQLDQFKLLGWMPVNEAGVKAVEGYSKASRPFIKAESEALPTSFAPVWSYVETGMLTAISNIASHLATSGSWSQAYANQQLATAQAAAQSHA